MSAIGRYGIWNPLLARPDGPVSDAEGAEAVAELEELGFGAVWLGGSTGVENAASLIAATSRITVATGIMSIWTYPADETAARVAKVESAHPGRFLLGLGVSHSKLTDRYQRPYAAMTEYLDALDAAGVGADRRVLAALGPRMLRLSRDRSAGAHPYLVTAEHTAQARDTLGEGPLLAPELGVVIDSDPSSARAAARGALARYLDLPNYTNNWLRLGFGEDDFTGGGSDRLIDTLFAWGDPARIRARADEFLAAGADHIAFQVISPEPLPREGWRRLAELLA